MLFNFIQHLLSVDVGWFMALIMNNLLWLFIFYAVMYVFMGGKKVLYGFVVFCLTLWVWQDFQNASGVAIFGAAFLSLWYITKLALLAVVESVPALSKKLIYINELHGLTLVLLFSLLAGGM